MHVKLLTDNHRLSEIYQLRVASYEQSAFSQYINAHTYPEGYFDDLDTLNTASHWIIQENEKIVGSVRAVIMDNKDLLKEDIASLNFPNETPFAYCGRTAVHPNYRRTDAMRLLDKAIMQYLKQNSQIKFGFCYVTPGRLNAVKRLGFESIGVCTYDWGNGNKTGLEAFIWKRV